MIYHAFRPEAWRISLSLRAFRGAALRADYHIVHQKFTSQKMSEQFHKKALHMAREVAKKATNNHKIAQSSTRTGQEGHQMTQEGPR